MDLYIFDIDDTLFSTTASIRVKDACGRVAAALTNQQYNEYVLKDGESFDFSEFVDAEKFRSESKPITAMIDNLIRISGKIKNSVLPGSKVIFNTARSDLDDVDIFLDTFRQQGIDMDQIHVHRAGNIPGSESNAEKKLIFIRDHLRKINYSHAFMYDDSLKNLEAFLGLKKEFPEVTFNAMHVMKSGNFIMLPGR